MPNPYPLPATPTVDPNAIIPTPDSAFNARSLANTGWALAFGASNNLAADNALFLTTYLGAGRFVGSDITVGNPVAGTGLTLRQPNATLLAQGRMYVVNNPDPTAYQVITGITGSQSGGVEVFAGISPDTGLLYTKPEWQTAALPATDAEKAVVAGLLHLGRAVTSASSVTSFTASTIDGRGIIRPRGTASGGGGGDSVPFAGDLLYLSDDLRPLSDIITDLYARIADVESAATNKDLDAPVDTDILADNQAIQEARLNALDPDGTAKAAISAVTGNAGHGQNSSADFTPTTGDANEMPFDLSDGSFG